MSPFSPSCDAMRSCSFSRSFRMIPFSFLATVVDRVSWLPLFCHVLLRLFSSMSSQMLSVLRWRILLIVRIGSIVGCLIRRQCWLACLGDCFLLPGCSDAVGVGSIAGCDAGRVCILIGSFSDVFLHFPVGCLMLPLHRRLLF